MRNTGYDKIADKHKAQEDRVKNASVAFLSGGIIGLIGEVIVEVLINNFNLIFNFQIFFKIHQLF